MMGVYIGVLGKGPMVAHDGTWTTGYNLYYDSIEEARTFLGRLYNLPPERIRSTICLSPTRRIPYFTIPEKCLVRAVALGAVMQTPESERRLFDRLPHYPKYNYQLANK